MRLFLVHVALCIVSIGRGDSCPVDLCDARAVAGYASLLASSRFGYANEHAAFVVRESDGRIRFVPWPANDPYHATHEGSIPAGTVAVAHTHPAGDLYPSHTDIAVAQRLGMPIVVLTLEAVTEARPDGRIDELISGQWWRKRR